LVLDENGNNLGRMPYRDAENLALERSLDLVRINKDNNGVVVFKIMDHGKHKYEQKKHKQKKTSHPVKEMTFKLRIDPHDLGIKVNRIKEFLKKGSDVKITVVMRGRERMSPNLAHDKLESILSEIKDLVKVQQKKESKSSIFVTVRPLSKKEKNAKQHERRSSAESADRSCSREVDQRSDDTRKTVEHADGASSNDGRTTAGIQQVEGSESLKTPEGNGNRNGRSEIPRNGEEGRVASS